MGQILIESVNLGHDIVEGNERPSGLCGREG